MIWGYLAVFCAVFFLDLVWAKYIAAAATGTPLAAALWAIPITVIGALTTLAYVRDPASIVAASLGAFAGTYLTKRYL